MKQRYRSAAVVVLMATLSSSGTAQPRSQPGPQPAQAQVDGRTAVGVWASRNGEILPQEPYTAYLAPVESPETELTFPAGSWFRPSDGTYRLWVESADAISPLPRLVTHEDRPFRGEGTPAVLEIGPAGPVAAEPDPAAGDRTSLRLLHVPPPRQTRLAPAFLRAAPAQPAGRSVLMPEGTVVGLLYDEEHRRYQAVSRPVEVRQGQTARIAPRLRSRPADLLVILHRPEALTLAEEDDVAVALVASDDRPRSPDLAVPTSDSIYALWYEVGLDYATLDVRSARTWLPTAELQLGGTGLRVFEGTLQARPWLDVLIELPPEIRPDKAEIVVTRPASQQRVAQEDLDDPTIRSLRIEGLPAEALTVTLTLFGDPGWTLHQRVDLQDGLGREIVFRPEPIHLSGRLYLDDEPRPGVVRIYTDHLRQRGDSVMVVESDERGHYEAVLQSPGRFPMSVALDGVDAPPFRPWPEHIDSDTTLDIHVPRSDVQVLVRDASTGSPVEGALVTYDSTYEVDGTTRGSSHNTATDDEGLAVLEPLHRGPLELWVEKEGYIRAGPVESIVEPGSKRSLRIDLEPAASSARLILSLPDGRPAAGAEVRAQRTGWNEAPAWQGRADDRGAIEIPDRAAGSWLLVRHPGAGSWIQGWDPRGREEVSWTLPPAGPPLVIRSVGHDGEPVPWSGVALRFPESWVAGAALGWLTGTHSAASNRGGLWTSSNLPAVRLGAIAGGPEVMRLALQGYLDGSARWLEPPWPAGPVELIVSQ